ncbi:MAG TPA: phospho-sugar mutase [Microbacteriaceae bacterium]|nr:phospho-sugar mutase [Microbacteriaceae bacterium]
MAEADETEAAFFARVRAWRDQDPDDETRSELTGLLEAAEATDPPAGAGAAAGRSAALAELHARFDTRLAFGTAGLRGELAAGPNRMNRVLVCQAARGLAAYLLEKAGLPEKPGPTETPTPSDRPGPARRPSVVIGYDGRKNSAVFARDTAEIMAGAGIRAILLPRLLPTPVLAFAVRHLDASAGVMVTASHNPPRDNGYKVYLGGPDAGSQIVAPADGEIARHIGLAANESVARMPRSLDYETADTALVDAYVARAAEAARRLAGDAALGDVRVAYTAMHGVGWATARRVFARAGIPEPAVVAQQIEPDPTFHTVAFPNPEEPGAMDLAFAAGRETHADLVVANDPDADRLAVAIPDPGPAGYRRLSGNEVGMLLGWAIAERGRGEGVSAHDTLAVSIVSSPALRQVASRYGLGYEETLTGFKWVSRTPRLLYGFEEALGYLVDPDAVRDKDGISAAAVFLTMARLLAARGVTIQDRLDEFARTFGYHASRQLAIRVADPARLATMMRRLRATPPDHVGRSRVRQIDDLADGFEGLPPSDVLRLHLEGGARVVVRPSGTEPKLKVYLDAASEAGSLEERKAAALTLVDDLAGAMAGLLDA